MPLYNGDQFIDEAILEALHRLVVGGKNSEKLLSKKRTIRESSFHDFSSYQFLFEPVRLMFPEQPDSGISRPPREPDIPLDIWIDFEDFASRFQTYIEGSIEEEVLVEGVELNEDMSDYSLAYDTTYTIVKKTRPIAFDSGSAFREGMAPLLFEAYEATSESERFLLAAQNRVSAWIQSQLRSMRDNEGIYKLSDLERFQSPTFWRNGTNAVLSDLSALNFTPVESGGNDDESEREEQDFGEVLPSSFSFDPFLPGSVNFGIQTVYRQGWTPLGTQPGEIVRTLPLGPKQTEKVTIKAIRRTQATKQAEISTSVETSTESSAATKDSSEVVQEASESFKWHTETSASASFGYGSASLSAGVGGENASSSRDTKTSLNEIMEKTASKIRKDTKIIVSTTLEESSEFTQVSEISNPNDQIAVTYIYSRLQRQYEIYTYLSEVNMVVFVAERIPSPREIDGAWVRRFDWILARELLDEGFRSDLEVVRNYSSKGASTTGIDKNIMRLMEIYAGEGKAGIPDYTKVPGTIPDMFRVPQEAYEREVERQRAREADDEQYFRSLRRLRAHIYDNILHYCRAIWSSEDPDARLLRYRQIRVPRTYEAIVSGNVDAGGATVTIAPSVNNPDQGTVPLSEIINPAGPIGFAGNYAIFYLKESNRWQSLTNILDILIAPYRRFAIQTSWNVPEGGRDDVKLRVVISPYRDGGGLYRVVRVANDEKPFNVFQQTTGNNQEILDPGAISFDGQVIRFHALRIEITNFGNIQVDDSFTIRLGLLPKLEDPELKAIRWNHAPIDSGFEEQFYTTEVIAEMRDFFSDVSNAMRDMPSDISWGTLNQAQQSMLTTRYFDYLLRKRHTRRLVVDTNNVLLTREVDDVTTLEPFKEVHRLIDVLSAVEDMRQKEIENMRRQKRVDSNDLGDPDVERVTVVATAQNPAGLAALDGLVDTYRNDEGDGEVIY